MSLYSTSPSYDQTASKRWLRKDLPRYLSKDTWGLPVSRADLIDTIEHLKPATDFAKSRLTG